MIKLIESLHFLYFIEILILITAFHSQTGSTWRNPHGSRRRSDFVRKGGGSNPPVAIRGNAATCYWFETIDLRTWMVQIIPMANFLALGSILDPNSQLYVYDRYVWTGHPKRKTPSRCPPFLAAAPSPMWWPSCLTALRRKNLTIFW